MTKSNNYYIGLDIGVGSVGWAVTDATDKYTLRKFNGKDMWGVRIFSEAETAENRRIQRSIRRRIKRTKSRKKKVNNFFKEKIEKVDSDFFTRLTEGRLHLEDKTTLCKYVLFADEDYTDKDFHKNYPTIYHLRKELIESKEPHDIRLVFLAIKHIIQNRGHFLIPGTLTKSEESEGYSSQNDLAVMLNQFKAAYSHYFNDAIEIDEKEFENVLNDKNIKNTEKRTRLSALIKYDPKDRDKSEIKIIKKRIDELCKLMIGGTGKLNVIFGEKIKTKLNDTLVEENKFGICFSKSDYEEKILPILEEMISDEIKMIKILQAFYNWQILNEIMNGEKYFSFAQVKKYEKHKDQLSVSPEKQPNLRSVFKKYLSPKDYKEFFNGQEIDGRNYSNYIGHAVVKGKKIKVHKCSKKDFYDALSAKLNNLKKSGIIEKGDEEIVDWLIEQSKEQKLLPLQRNKDNSFVPKQVHEAELIQILRNAETYLPFLAENDEDGISISEKIVKIFNFRIPYYVGPLGGKNDDPEHNHWLVRKEGKENEEITPWNFEEVVDLKKTNEKFIMRLINDCTYLRGEKVLPKESLLYTKYMVLEEINKIKILGEDISVELKKDMYQDLFSEGKKVTYKKMADYLRKYDKKYESIKIDSSMLGGIDQERTSQNFKATLSSLAVMKNIFGDNLSEDQIKMSEDIIKWSTVYDDDSQMLLEMVKENYGDILTEDQIKKIEYLSFKDWGNFSEKFLIGIPFMNTETGECYDNLLDCMWETNDNLQQILYGPYDLNEKINKLNSDKSNKSKEFSYDALVKDLITSPSNKRAIWQALQIVKEIVKCKKGNAAEKIFIEMARGGGDKERTQSRREKLTQLITASESPNKNELLEELKNTSDRDLKKRTIYLYFLQEGKCAYSGESVDLNALKQGNRKWDIDHIYPQSKIKDDSIYNNLVLTNKTINNDEKGDGPVPKKYQKKMRDTWERWRKSNFINSEKYYRLNRETSLTPEERAADFSNYQLVSTRQISKFVAEILAYLYPETKIVFVKASLVSDFRKDMGMLKCRDINDYHHAKDAYLNIVVGNAYYTQFTANPKNWFSKNTFNLKKMFKIDIKGAWKMPTENDKGTLNNVRNTMLQNDILYTEPSYCQKGEMYNATLQKKRSDDKKSKLLPLKKGLDPKKYGGYHTMKTSYFALIEMTDKKNNRVKSIVRVPIYVANMLKYNPNAFLEFCNDALELKNVEVIIPKIKMNSLITVDGFPMRIRGSSGTGNYGDKLVLKQNVQLVTSPETEETIRLVKKWEAKKKENGNLKIDTKYDKLDEESLDKAFAELIDLLKSERYANRPGNPYQKKVKSFVENNKFADLALEEKSNIIDKLLDVFSCEPSKTADLRAMGGEERAGKISKAINFNKNKVTLIDESVTGLFVIERAIKFERDVKQ